MRFGFDGTPLLGPRTGVGWYTYELIRAVARQAPTDSVEVLPISWRTARHANLGEPHPANVRVLRRVAPARPLWALWDRFQFPPIEWLVGCDVFHATNFIAPPSRRVPVVVTVHDVGFVHHPDQVGPTIRRMAELLPKVLARAAAVIAVSDFTRAELVHWQPSVAGKVTVVPNGGHSRAPASPCPNDGAGASGHVPPGDYALVLGTLEPRKNLALALDALVVLRDRGVDLRLVLAGAPSPLLDVDALLATRGLGSDDAVRTGYVDDASAAALMAGARMLVFPSLYEGFGMPLVEAMEAGVPVVAVRAGATPETVGDAAALVDPGDAEGMAAAMEEILSDDTRRTAMVTAGRVRAAGFSWDRAASATIDVYRRVAGR
ncbi:MAG: glycosyltransferase family 4 protein [Acidimicrobiales bacterium]